MAETTTTSSKASSSKPKKRPARKAEAAAPAGKSLRGVSAIRAFFRRNSCLCIPGLFAIGCLRITSLLRPIRRLRLLLALA